MRVSDIVRLSLKHIDWERNTVSFKQYKTDMPVQYPDDFLFSNRKEGALRCDWLEQVHSRLLYMAGIPSASAAGRTKRLHDWRHTHAVSAFKQMVECGHDMYVALPILSAYMGHANIMATERYLRLAVNLYPYLQKKFDAALEDIFGKEVHGED